MPILNVVYVLAAMTRSMMAESWGGISVVDILVRFSMLAPTPVSATVWPIMLLKLLKHFGDSH